ncbi:MAG: FhaA domain-containing protein [Vulcanimicrobiaceae bacterium]
MFARLEAACASAVERAFALAFPSALEPVQIARKLVAAFEAGGAPDGRGGRRFTVLLAPGDLVRFERNRAYLERQWSAMLARLAERSGFPQRAPEVTMHADPSVAAGTVGIAVEPLPEPTRLSLRLRRGVPPGAQVALRAPLVVGRDATCELALLDPRVSRRHLALEMTNEGAVRFSDLGSSNGTYVNGRRVSDGTLRCGDVVVLGDSELVVQADEEAAP